MIRDFSIVLVTATITVTVMIIVGAAGPIRSGATEDGYVEAPGLDAPPAAKAVAAADLRKAVVAARGDTERDIEDAVNGSLQRAQAKAQVVASGPLGDDIATYGVFYNQGETFSTNRFYGQIATMDADTNGGGAEVSVRDTRARVIFERVEVTAPRDDMAAVEAELERLGPVEVGPAGDEPSGESTTVASSEPTAASAMYSPSAQTLATAATPIWYKKPPERNWHPNKNWTVTVGDSASYPGERYVEQNVEWYSGNLSRLQGSAGGMHAPGIEIEAKQRKGDGTYYLADDTTRWTSTLPGSYLDSECCSDVDIYTVGSLDAYDLLSSKNYRTRVYAKKGGSSSDYMVFFAQSTAHEDFCRAAWCTNATDAACGFDNYWKLVPRSGTVTSITYC